MQVRSLHSCLTPISLSKSQIPYNDPQGPTKSTPAFQCLFSLHLLPWLQMTWPPCYAWNMPECSHIRIFVLAVPPAQNAFPLDICIVNSPDSSMLFLIPPLLSVTTLLFCLIWQPISTLICYSLLIIENSAWVFVTLSITPITFQWDIHITVVIMSRVYILPSPTSI